MSRVLVLLAIVSVLLAACGSNPPAPFERSVDERSGESFTHARQPLRLVTSRPALSRVGKDYLFVAPVLVSGSNAPQDYLWFSIGSSIDREITGAAAPEVNAVVLVLDGAPMTFDLKPWNEIADSSPFDPGVEHHASFGSKVTKSQLRYLASAVEVTAFVTNSADRSPEFELVAGEYTSWSEF